MDTLSLMFFITDLNAKKSIRFLDKYKIKFKIMLSGTGTASSSVLDYFGLNEIEKCIVLCIMPSVMSKNILKDMHDKLNIHEPGKGIAFSVPISSSVKHMIDKYKDIKMEDVEMEKANKHLIITIANEGFAETIMSAAKKVGATGGTTISGRGLETEKVIKFLGLSIEPEKDVVLILADSDKKNDIMDQIVDTCGLKTPGAGICFSLPVDYVVGLDKEI